MQLLSNERRFILAVVAGDLVISNRKKADIEAQLKRDGYDCMPQSKKVSKARTPVPLKTSCQSSIWGWSQCQAWNPHAAPAPALG